MAKSKRGAKGLTAGDAQETLDALAGRLSTRSLQITRNCLERAIPHAEVRDLVGRNVAALVKVPAGRSGRPSKSLTLEQAQELLQAAGGSGLYAYVVLSVTTGLRTEELRALRWNEVDLDAGTVAVYRAVRATADTKTPKSRRVLSLPRLVRTPVAPTNQFCFAELYSDFQMFIWGVGGGSPMRLASWPCLNGVFTNQSAS